MYTESYYDLLVIGGGINGAGIAADAAGRGLSVLLCEQNDLASGTSSASSKLVHGGLRYLESYHFDLVRESLKEREILLKTAPHLVRKMRFVVPYSNSRRPFWIIRAGLFLYDLFGFGDDFKRSKMIRFDPNDPLSPLKRSIRNGFIYSDAHVDDARLVITNALRIVKNNGVVANYTRCINVKRMQDHWQAQLQNQFTQQIITVKCKALINAAGPFAEKVLHSVINLQSDTSLKLVKGSHIVVPKLYNRPEAYVLQHKDGRIIFVIPYQQQYTLIGTTEISYNGDPQKAKISIAEIDYLCEIVSEYFHHSLKSSQVVHAWSGIRPLVNDKNVGFSGTSREYKIDLQVNNQGELPLINIFGGKLTTYRALAEKTINSLKPFFPQMSDPFTATRPLPGGDDAFVNQAYFLEMLSHRYSWLPSQVAFRFASNYGTLSYQILKDTSSLAELGHHFGHGLYEKEVVYLIEHEWARTLDDIIWRRTKLGLFLQPHEIEELQKWLNMFFHRHFKFAI